jgi:steroid delta-isomerase-like uncharacterized protein
VLNYDPFKIAQAHLEAWNNRNPILYKDLLAPAATLRFTFEKAEKPLLKAYEEYLKLWFDAFPDVRWEHLNIIPAHGTLTIEWIARGTHLGTFMQYPPTGRKGEVRGTTVFKINEDGKVYKEIAYVDLGVILGHLGVLPPPLPEEKLREIAMAIVETYNLHDMQKLITFFTPDGRMILPEGRSMNVRETFTWQVTNLLAIPDLKFEVNLIAVRLNEVVLEGALKGVHKYPLANLPATHREIKLDLCMVLTFVQDKVQEVRQYTDQVTLLREIGVIPDEVIR